MGRVPLFHVLSTPTSSWAKQSSVIHDLFKIADATGLAASAVQGQYKDSNRAWIVTDSDVVDHQFLDAFKTNWKKAKQLWNEPLNDDIGPSSRRSDMTLEEVSYPDNTSQDDQLTCKNCHRTFPLPIFVAHVGQCSVKVCNGSLFLTDTAETHLQNRSIGTRPLSVTQIRLPEGGTKPFPTTPHSASAFALEMDKVQNEMAEAFPRNPDDVEYQEAVDQEAMEDGIL